jgi:hypothetical protein
MESAVRSGERAAADALAALREPRGSAAREPGR